MKLMQNGLFIDEIWAKIVVGTLSYRWNLILAVGSQFGSNLAVGSLYYHWDSNLAVRSTRVWSGPSDHARERGPIFRKKSPKNRRLIGFPSDISLKSPLYQRYIADFLAIFCEKSPLQHISSKYRVACLRYMIYRRYLATFSSLVVRISKFSIK